MGRGRSARNAAQTAFYETIAEVLRCVSADDLTVLTGSAANTYALTFPRRRSKLSVKGGGRLSLAVTHWYAVVETDPGEWRVRTDSYSYTVFDDEQREAIGYHYHPKGKGEDPLPVPHLHIYQSGAVCGVYLPKVHLRTGRVALEDVVEMLITDFGVEPHHPYAEEAVWRGVLNKARADFARLRRWSSWGQSEV